MSTRLSVPEPWASRMVDCGFVDPRTGEASLSALNTAGGPAVETLRRLVHGWGKPQEETIRVVAALLRVAPKQIRLWANVPTGENEPYTPPAESARLTQRQRRAIDELIRSMLADDGAIVHSSSGLYDVDQQGNLRRVPDDDPRRLKLAAREGDHPLADDDYSEGDQGPPGDGA